MQPNAAVLDRSVPVGPRSINPVGENDGTATAWRKPPEGRTKMAQPGMTIDTPPQTARKGRIDKHPRRHGARIKEIVDKLSVMARQRCRRQAMRQESSPPWIDLVQDKASARMGRMNREEPGSR